MKTKMGMNQMATIYTVTICAILHTGVSEQYRLNGKKALHYKLKICKQEFIYTHHC